MIQFLIDPLLQGLTHHHISYVYEKQNDNTEGAYLQVLEVKN